MSWVQGGTGKVTRNETRLWIPMWVAQPYSLSEAFQKKIWTCSSPAFRFVLFLHEKQIPSTLPSSTLAMAGELASNDESRQTPQLRKFLNSFWTSIYYFTFLFRAYLFPLQRQLTKKPEKQKPNQNKNTPKKTRNQLVYCIDVLPGNLIVVAVSKNPAPWLMSYSPLNHAWAMQPFLINESGQMFYNTCKGVIFLCTAILITKLWWFYSCPVIQILMHNRKFSLPNLLELNTTSTRYKARC